MVNIKALNAPKTKDMGSTGAPSGSKETELVQWRLF